MYFSRFISTLSNLYIYVFTWLHGEFVGEDLYGNRYYREKARNTGKIHAKGQRLKRERRWAIYKDGRADASQAPPEWFGWLHYIVDQPSETDSKFRKPWQKDYQPSMTGTDRAYLPPGHTLAGGHRDKATGDYEAWKPN